MRFFAAIHLFFLAPAISARHESLATIRGDNVLNGRVRRLQNSCNEDIAEFLEGLASDNQDLEAQGLTMDCQCTEEGEFFVSCSIDRGEVCNSFDCSLGWTCLDPSVDAVEVCQTIGEEQIWKIGPDGGFNRIVVRDERVYTTGVANLERRRVDVYRDTGECDYLVDGTMCNSCEVCPGGRSVSADCDNIIAGATAACGDVIGLLYKLFTLGEEPATTVGPMGMETEMPSNTMMPEGGTDMPSSTMSPS